MLPETTGELIPYVGWRGRGCPRWRAGWLRRCVCRGHVQNPALAPGSSKWQSGFFGLFVPFVQNVPQLCLQAVVFIPSPFLGISLLKEQCVPGASLAALQQRFPLWRTASQRALCVRGWAWSRSPGTLALLRLPRLSSLLAP